MPHLVQLVHAGGGRAVARVDGSGLLLCEGPASVYALAREALDRGESLREAVDRATGGRRVDYDEVYEGRGDWRLLPPIDHPEEPARCLITGTGLTHLRSAESRDAMHTAPATADRPPTDSMVMYRWGVEGGRPAPGLIGVAPEWFYKGPGGILRSQNEPLDVPEYAEDGGEEAEIAGLYIVDRQGAPRRIGMAAGNEFSDHAVEKRNYLYLAHSKLRTCSLGPELVTDAPFDSVKGRVRVERRGAVVWEREFLTGERHMCHSLANLEHHHFRSPQHRRPGDIHVHFFGASAFSSGEGVRVEHGDEMVIEFEGYGRALRNPLRAAPGPDRLVSVLPL